MSNIKIVKATENVFYEILDLEYLIFSPPWTEGSLMRELYSDSALFLTAISEGEVVGYAILHSIAQDEAEIYKIAVSEKFRRKGVAALLMHEMMEHVKKNKIEHTFLEVRESNTPAIMLYNKFGFESVARRYNYYQDPVENALIMTVHTEDDAEKNIK